MLASNGNSLPAERRAALLLHIVGHEAVEIYQSFQLTDEEKKDPEKIIKKFDDYCIPKTNITIERHKFHCRVQARGESFEAFYAELVKMAALCDFGNLKDDLVKDRILCGINDSRVKNRLLREDNLDLSKTIKICKAAEESVRHITTLQPAAEVHDVERFVKKNNFNSKNTKGRQQSSDNNKKPSAGCSKCGTKHQYARCPAYKNVCHKCKGENHFAKMCKRKVVQTVEEVDNSNQLLTVHCSNDVTNSKDWFALIYVKEIHSNVKFKIDTGAQINVLPASLFKNVKCKINVKPYIGTVSGYGGTVLDVVGFCTLTVVINQQEYKLDFVIINTNHTAVPLIGLTDLERLNLIYRSANVFEIHTSFDTLLNKNNHLFEGIGRINSIKCAFKLKQNYESVAIRARRIPFRLVKQVKYELDRLCQDNIITEVSEATEFVSPLLVLAKPNKKIRLVLDPQYLNEALYREYHQLPTFEEITSDMIGSKFFTTLDANRGFWQIELTNEASKLTTFSTPFGRYRFLRLPFGLRNAPEIFQRVFSQIFADIPSVKIYIDDIIIYAKSIDDHNEILKKVFDRANKFGVKFNKDKSKFLLKEIKYVGHILTENGIKPDSDKIIAIKNIPEPKNLKELTRFLVRYCLFTMAE